MADDQPRAEPAKTKPKNGGILSDRAARNIIYVVVGIWAASAVAGMFPKVTGYTPPGEIHGAFMAIVGTVLIARSRGDDQ